MFLKIGKKRGQRNFLVSNCWERRLPVETLRSLGAISSPDGYCYFKLHRSEDFLENVSRSLSRREKANDATEYDYGVGFAKLSRFFLSFALHFAVSHLIG